MSATASAAKHAGDKYVTARFHMVEGQLRTNRVTESRLLDQLLTIPRQIFVPETLASVAYIDESIRIAPDRYLTEPLALARLLQEAAVEPGDNVLVVGVGTGYSAAILAGLADKVTALECDTGLATTARTLLSELGLINATVVDGPLEAGCLAAAPYDVILIDGMIETLPEALTDQLAENGRLVTMLERELRCGVGMIYRKLGGRVSGRVLFDATVPLLPGFSRAPAFQF
jgi:protein-L-isoaspartate(D-aspartate) O-methyltransferase